MPRNPFRSEAEAFRFLWLTVAAFALVAVASVLGGTWAALAVWLVVSAAAVVVYLRRGRARRALRTAPQHLGAPEERRVLVLAERPLPDGAVEQIRGRGDRVLVVAPAETTPLHTWVSDVDAARADADARVVAAVAALRSVDVDAAGAVGDGQPLQAVEDALRTFGGDEIVVAAESEELVASIRERFALPVTPV